MEKLTAERQKQCYLKNFSDLCEVEQDYVSVGHFDKIDEENEELWLLQCPKGMDLNELVENKFKLPGRSHTEELDVIATERAAEIKETPTTFGYCTKKSGYCLRKLPIRGNIIVRQRLPAVNSPAIDKLSTELNSSQNEKDHLSTQFKVRHPLLGSKFKKIVDLPQHISERLNNADENSTNIIKQSTETPKKNSKKSRAQFKKAQSVVNLDSDNDDDDEQRSSSLSTRRGKAFNKDQSVINIESDCDLSIKQNTAVDGPKKRKSDRAKSILTDVPEGLKWLTKI